MRPDLKLVAVAASDNWTFLGKLQPDEQAVDFFHAYEHLGEVADRAVATDRYDKYRITLRDAADGGRNVLTFRAFTRPGAGKSPASPPPRRRSR